MSALAELIRRIQAGLLGQADLAPLQQALEAAAPNVHSSSPSKRGRTSMRSTNSPNRHRTRSIKRKGNEAGLENRRHQKTLKDLQDAAKLQPTTPRTYLQAVADDENKLHELKLQHIREQQDAQNNRFKQQWVVAIRNRVPATATMASAAADQAADLVARRSAVLQRFTYISTVSSRPKMGDCQWRCRSECSRTSCARRRTRYETHLQVAGRRSAGAWRSCVPDS